MADITADQVVEAAKALGKDEFNREEVATQLGVDKQAIRPAFREARQGRQAGEDARRRGQHRLLQAHRLLSTSGPAVG